MVTPGRLVPSSGFRTARNPARASSAQHADDDQDQQDDEHGSETDVHGFTSQVIARIVPITARIETAFQERSTQLDT
jgi:ABC-type Zn2+ transport system substrate-binding protein/surface adhesin